jgi:hypothetical protein
MTTYPGENPEPPEGQPEAGDSGSASDPAPETEPTQPVGYWERQAAEQASEQQGHPESYTSPSGAVFNPTSAQPSSGWEQGGTRPYEQAPYGQQHPGQQPYGQPTYQPTYGQPAYGQPSYGYPPPGGQSGQPGSPYPPYAAFSAPRPDHPQANLSLILGIVGIIGGFMCGIGFVLSPFAWALGRNAGKEIQASQGRLGGEGSAKAGMITGIVGTVLLGIGVLLLIGVAVLIAIGGTSSGGSI